jgi:CBS domain-containing protein
VKPILEVRDYMSTQLVVATPRMSVHEAMHLMVEHEVSGLPVVDSRARVVGVLSERDCLEVAFEAGYHAGLGARVADVMTREVETLEAGGDVVAAIERFLRGSYRRYPVVEAGRIVGQLSRRDALRALMDLEERTP